MSVLNTVKCEMCQDQKSLELVGSGETGGWYVAEKIDNGIQIVYAPSNTEDMVKYSYHFCGLDHAWKYMSKLLPPISSKSIENSSVLEA